MQNHNKEQISYGGFFARWAAYIVDSIIVGLALLVLKMPVAIAGFNNPELPLIKQVLFEYSVWDIFLYLLSVMYFVILTYNTGQTVGKKLFNLKVVSADDSKLSLLNVIYRETIGRYLSSVIMCAGYIMAGIDKEKKGLHDILCDTRVIYACKIKYTYSYPTYPPSVPYQNGPMNPPNVPYQNGPMNPPNPSYQNGPMNLSNPSYQNRPMNPSNVPYQNGPMNPSNVPYQNRPMNPSNPSYQNGLMNPSNSSNQNTPVNTSNQEYQNVQKNSPDEVCQSESENDSNQSFEHNPVKSGDGNNHLDNQDNSLQ